MSVPSPFTAGTSETQWQHEKKPMPQHPRARPTATVGDGKFSDGRGAFIMNPAKAARPTYQMLVFTDPVAFRYLQEDLSVEVVHSHKELVGYELYLVEQWACSRAHPTFIITVFTGLPQHKVSVGVLSVPTDESQWSPRLRVYLQAVSNFHARKTETPLGTLMVTNLSSFPSALTVISITGGDLKEHRDIFIVNEDMKRLGCSGRAGLNLSAPSGATSAKFIQLYRTSDRVGIPEAVIELVKLCQIALVMFARLAPEYADGLLCDLTERAINDWWTKVGMDYYNVEPSDGILGPATVAALLGLFLGARNRLNAYGAPVAKDAFDIKAMKRGIGHFQKSQKLPKSRRLDPRTLDRLHMTTSKAANSEKWMVPKAVKSTVAELGGKGGEMVMGMVARDKAGIAEVETLDIRRFIETLSGERCKWLWHGKPKKSNSNDFFTNLVGEDDAVFSAEENTGHSWPGKNKEALAEHAASGHIHRDRLYMDISQGSQTSLDVSERDQAFRKAVFRSVTGRMSDARSGLERFKDVVGIPNLRGHYHKHSRERLLSSPAGPSTLLPTDENQSTATEQRRRPVRGHLADRQVAEEEVGLPGSSRTESIPLAHRNRTAGIEQEAGTPEEINGRRSDFDAPTIVARPSDLEPSLYVSDPEGGTTLEDLQPTTGNSIFPRPWEPGTNCSSQSLMLSRDNAKNHSELVHLLRHTSFSVVEDVLSGIDNRNVLGNNDLEAGARYDSWTVEQQTSMRIQKIASQIQHLELHTSRSADTKQRELEKLEDHAKRIHDEMSAKHFKRYEEHNSLRDATIELIRQEDSFLTEAFKDMDVLGAKLEYELNALIYKVEDVEIGVSDLERQVLDLEERTQNLRHDSSHDDRWVWKVWRFVAPYK